ncbi:MAG: sel1 repeat family protein [Polyangiaceae bacterium]|nr:sel1 repeat family protein [Polyangiaceae bacterium]
MLPFAHASLALAACLLLGCAEAPGPARSAVAPADGAAGPGGAVAAGSPGTATCSGGRVSADRACCWPGQLVAPSGEGCLGAPSCPVGTYLAEGDCRAVGAQVAALVASCGADRDTATFAAAVARMGDCQKLAALGPEVERYLAARCAAADGASCTLLGHAARRQMSLGIETSLVSPPCASASASCNAQVQRALPFEFALGPAGSADPAAASRRFQQGCDGGHQDGCLAIAELTAGSNPFGAAELYGRACRAGRTAACAHAVYLFRAAGRVEDTALEAEIARQLGVQCDLGTASACNALGFVVERGVGVPPSADGARALYGRACRAGDAIGCANLAFEVVNQPKLAAQSPLDAAALGLLEQTCRGDEIKETCLAAGVMLVRGVGTKKDAKRARALLKPLCDRGYREACREMR